MITVVLPWPPRQLSPNQRLHWSAVSKAKGRYRFACSTLMREALKGREVNADRLNVAFTFYPPDKRHRDTDNMIAAMKAGIDGMADALGVDDSKWRMSFEVAPDVGGMVKVRIA